MQAYGKLFAQVYNMRWSGFARYIAPYLLNYYTATPAGQENKNMLDLCCGTGQLALHFLERGFRVTGLDASEYMLQYARENNQQHVDSGHARFVHGDAADFKMEERYGLIVSTFDALNHLENDHVLRSCFECVQAVCDGLFIFDLNTRHGLKRWNNIQVDEGSDDALIISRGIYDDQSDKAWTRISGFVRQPNGYYERFEETAFNTAFAMEAVRTALYETGWQRVHFARIEDLKTPIADPEQEGRIFFVAS